MVAPEPADDFDLESVTSLAEFAELLRRLHLRAGKPSLRQLAQRDPGKGADGRRRARLSRSTLSAILAGQRLPSQDTLIALLAVLNVENSEHARWLAARGRLEGHRGATAAAEPARGSRHRWLLWIAAGVIAVLAAAIIVVGYRDTGTTIRCEPASCAAGPALPLTGRLGEQLHPGQQPHLLILVQSTQRWYVGPAVTADADGAWQQQVNIGAPKPQAKDRHFSICLFALPATDLDRLIQLQMRNDGAGLSAVDLPPNRTELVCVPAIRLAGT